MILEGGHLLRRQAAVLSEELLGKLGLEEADAGAPVCCFERAVFRSLCLIKMM